MHCYYMLVAVRSSPEVVTAHLVWRTMASRPAFLDLEWSDLELNSSALSWWAVGGVGMGRERERVEKAWRSLSASGVRVGGCRETKIIHTISYLPKHKWTTWHCMFFQITTETCSFVHNLTGASCSSFEFVSEYLIACHVTSKGFEFESKLHKSLILSYTLLWDSVVGVGQFVGCVFY